MSPSSLESREACPGWESMDKDSIWADDGERCHEAIQAKINGDDTLHNALEKDLHNFVTEAYDYAAPRIAGAHRIITEERLYHSDPVLKVQSYGTPDLYTVTGQCAAIIDFKFGRRPVSHAKHNLQGWTYVLALFDTFPEVTDCTMDFYVPRVYRCTSSWSFNRGKDYQRLFHRIANTVANAMRKDRMKHYHVGWDSCAYCGRKATCIPIQIEIRKSMKNTITETDPKTLSDQLNMAKLATDWAEQTSAYVLDQALDHGREVEGFEVRVTGGKTSTKPLDIIAGVLKGKIKLEDLAEIATVPLNKLKELYAELGEHDTKAAAEEELMKLLVKGNALKTSEDSPYLYRLNKS